MVKRHCNLRRDVACIANEWRGGASKLELEARDAIIRNSVRLRWTTVTWRIAFHKSRNAAQRPAKKVREAEPHSSKQGVVCPAWQ